MRLATRIIYIFTLISIGLTYSQSVDSLSGSGKLTVIISGFENETGNCRFALDNSEKVFEGEDTVWIGKELPIINKEVVVTIDSLQFGEYAIRVFHDENEDDVVNTNILGIPTEDYGYSNDASGWFGPPSWEKAKFIFNKSEMTIYIDVD
jgi:uncharacterized protein (DUF2141 family)